MGEEEKPQEQGERVRLVVGLLGKKAGEHCLTECVGICCGRVVESEDAIQVRRLKSKTERISL